MCFLWLDEDDDGHILDIKVFVCTMASAFQNMKVQLFIHSPKSRDKGTETNSGSSNYSIKRNDTLAEKWRLGGKKVIFISCGCMMGFHDLTNMREVERLVSSISPLTASHSSPEPGVVW